MKVFVVTCCRNEAGIFGNTLVFQSIRTGFPTAEIVVLENASTHGLDEIRKAAADAGATLIEMAKRVDHHEAISRALYAEHGPVVFCDPDVIFWGNFEEVVGERIIDGDIMAGRYLPTFKEYGATVAPRLHTSLLVIPNAERLHAAMQDLQTKWFSDFRRWEGFVFNHPEAGPVHYDTGAVFFSFVKDHCYAFGERELNLYDHLFCGTAPDLVPVAMSPGTAGFLEGVRQQAMMDPASIRGLWRKQEEWLKGIGGERAAATEFEMHLRWARGNQDAAQLIQALGRGCQLGDAFVDNDVNDIGATLESRSSHMVELLLLATGLDKNPFWRQHQGVLRPVMISSLLMWDATNTWQDSPSEKTRMYAWAYREILDQVIVMVALLLGGLEHSRRVAREVHEFYHARASEPFAEWDRQRQRSESDGR